MPPLLPSGCYDLLPPYAAQESALVAQLLSTFESFGYAQVTPPLLEYTESLLAGRGAALAGQVYRVMDHSHGGSRVMGIRADHTMQIGRIASTRLQHAPRPLRLGYAGNVLLLRENSRDLNRQLLQAGIELIGSPAPEADAEVMRVAAEALGRAGIPAFTLDLNLPGLVGLMLAGDALSEEEAESVLIAVAHKDIAAIRAAKLVHAEALAGLMEHCGPAKTALPAICALPLPEKAREALESLMHVARLAQPMLEPRALLTVDLTESRGFEYHTGVGFSLFAPGATRELGRGGRYRIELEGAGEDATGCTLYVDTLRRLVPEPEPRRVVTVPADTPRAEIERIQAEGAVTVLALPTATPPART